jgi:hypothetical protein
MTWYEIQTASLLTMSQRIFRCKINGKVVIVHYAKKTYGGVDVWLHYFYTRRQLKVSGHLQAPAVLPPPGDRRLGWPEFRKLLTCFYHDRN